MGLKNFLSSFFYKDETPPQKREAMRLKDSLSTWIDMLNKQKDIPKEICALNFGLFESDKGTIIYLTGSKIYDSSNDDWASEIDYEPKAKYKYHLLTGEEVVDLKWDEVLTLVSKVLKELIDEHSEHSLFANKTITVGFDDGNLVVLKS